MTFTIDSREPWPHPWAPYFSPEIKLVRGNLSKAGWSWGRVSTIDSNRRTIWIADAHRETAFIADQDKTDISAWLYNSTPEQPRDLGYWVGYRIVKSYYQHANDKRQAFHEILEMTDPKAFLAKSGWYPGIQLQ
jgi:hypothetical protein